MATKDRENRKEPVGRKMQIRIATLNGFAAVQRPSRQPSADGKETWTLGEGGRPRRGWITCILS
jgi:hypothetical protein